MAREASRVYNNIIMEVLYLVRMANTGKITRAASRPRGGGPLLPPSRADDEHTNHIIPALEFLWRDRHRVQHDEDGIRVRIYCAADSDEMTVMHATVECR